MGLNETKGGRQSMREDESVMLSYISMDVCVCVCVCVLARVCVCVCACACVYI